MAPLSPRTFAAAALALAALPASGADVLRCGNSLIRTGMTAAEVTARCGEPSAKEIVEVPVHARRPTGAVERIGTTHIERWTYSRGGGQFPALLTFDQGELESIELLTGR